MVALCCFRKTWTWLSHCARNCAYAMRPYAFANHQITCIDSIDSSYLSSFDLYRIMVDLLEVFEQALGIHFFFIDVHVTASLMYFKCTNHTHHGRAHFKRNFIGNNFCKIFKFANFPREIQPLYGNLSTGS